MRRRMHPTEVRMVEDILMSDEEDATVTAREIVRAINDKRHGEKTYIALLWDAETGRYLSAWGPYPTAKAAATDVEKGGVIASRACVATLAVLVTSDTEEE